MSQSGLAVFHYYTESKKLMPFMTTSSTIITRNLLQESHSLNNIQNPSYRKRNQTSRPNDGKLAHAFRLEHIKKFQIKYCVKDHESHFFRK